MLDMCGICVVDTFEMDMCGICKMCWICVGYVWCEIRQQSSEEPCDETSFGKKIKSHCCHTCHACHACQQLKTCQRFPMSNKNASCDTIAWDVSGVAKQLYGS